MADSHEKVDSDALLGGFIIGGAYIIGGAMLIGGVCEGIKWGYGQIAGEPNTYTLRATSQNNTFEIIENSEYVTLVGNPTDSLKAIKNSNTFFAFIGDSSKIVTSEVLDNGTYKVDTLSVEKKILPKIEFSSD